MNTRNKHLFSSFLGYTCMMPTTAASVECLGCGEEGHLLFIYIILWYKFLSLHYVGILFSNLKNVENILNTKITYSVYSNISFIVIRNKIFSLTIYLGQGWHGNKVAIWAKEILLRDSKHQVKDLQNFQRKNWGAINLGEKTIISLIPLTFIKFNISFNY